VPAKAPFLFITGCNFQNGEYSLVLQVTEAPKDACGNEWTSSEFETIMVVKNFTIAR
jgi:hypothetical protein